MPSCVQSMMGPYAKYGLIGAGAGLLFYAFGAQKGGPISTPGSSCKLVKTLPCMIELIPLWYCLPCLFQDNISLFFAIKRLFDNGLGSASLWDRIGGQGSSLLGFLSTPYDIHSSTCLFCGPFIHLCPLTTTHPPTTQSILFPHLL